MKRILASCFILFVLSSYVSADPIEKFLKKESLKHSDNIQFLLLNSSDCNKCNALTKALHTVLSKFDHYYLVFTGIRSKNINYYMHNVLQLSDSKAKGIVDDTLFNFLTNGMGSRVICLHGNEIYFNKALDEVKQPFNLKEFQFLVTSSDSVVLDEHIVPLNAKDYKTNFLGGNKFLLWDTHFKNLITYDKNTGRQLNLVRMSSGAIKDIYTKHFSSTTNWDTVVKKIKGFEKANLSAFSFHQFQNNENKFYILASFRLPTFRTGDTVDLYMKMFILEYDSSLTLQKKYLINETTIPGNYYLNEFSGFTMFNDVLYLNIQRYADMTKFDGSTKTIGAFRLNKEKEEFNLTDTFRTLPDFYIDNKMYYEFAENFIFINKISKRPINIYTYTPDVYDFSSKNYKTINGLKYYNKPKEITNDSVKYKFSFFYQSDTNTYNFIVWEQGNYFVVSNTTNGEFKRKIKIFNANSLDKGMQFFTDNEKLFGVLLNKDKVILYKYSFADFD